MPNWVRILIALLLEIFQAVKEPEAKGLVLRSIGAVKGTPDPNPEKSARLFRRAVAVGKIPKKAQGPVWQALRDGGALAPEEEEPPEFEDEEEEEEGGEG